MLIAVNYFSWCEVLHKKRNKATNLYAFITSQRMLFFKIADLLAGAFGRKNLFNIFFLLRLLVPLAGTAPTTDAYKATIILFN